MKPVENILPYINDSKSLETTIKGNDIANDMPAIITTEGTGGPIAILSRWRLTDDEIVNITKNKSIWVTTLTGGNSMQPIRLEVDAPKSLPVVIVKVEEEVDGEVYQSFQEIVPNLGYYTEITDEPR